MNKKISEFSELEQRVAKKEINVSLMEARQYRGVRYWCSSDGLCELYLDVGAVCGSEQLLQDLINADMEAKK